MNSHLRLPARRLLLSLVLLTVVLAAGLLPGPAPVLARPNTYVLIVDNAGDASGGACIAGIPTDCSLRSAIELANAYVGADAINILFADSYTIGLGSNLPTITASYLELWARNTSYMPVVVQIDRHATAACPAGACPALSITGSHIRLMELYIYGAGPGSSNVWIHGSAHRVSILACVIGDDQLMADTCGLSPYTYSGVLIESTGALSGEERAGIANSVVKCNQGNGDGSGYGIVVSGADGVLIGDDETIGSPAPVDIRLNAADGIALVGPGAKDNVIVGNRIGVDASAAAAAANGRVGIYAGDLAATTLITGNLISGNGWSGILLSHTESFTITNNLIGTNASGNAALPNGNDGIALADGAQHTHIGGLPADTRNVISGNAWLGVRISGVSNNNTIYANYIGLSRDGTAAIPNGAAGVAIFGSHANAIGYPGTASEGQTFISGNTREGIYIEYSDYTSINRQSYIGVQPGAGTALRREAARSRPASPALDELEPLGNGREGILLVDSSDTIIETAVLAFNGLAGVSVVGDDSQRNSIVAAVNMENGGLPIDLGGDGATPNDPGDGDSGPNEYLDYPVITTYSSNVITGTACANCTVNVFYRYRNPGAARGGGEFIYPVSVDNYGHWHLTLPGQTRRSQIALTANKSLGDGSTTTSEMSPWWSADLPLALVAH